MLYKYARHTTHSHLEGYTPDQSIDSTKKKRSNKRLKKPKKEQEYDSDTYITEVLSQEQGIRINDFFEEKQFHTDYRDTTDAFTLMIPNRKALFNTGDLPARFIKGKPQEVQELVTKFITEINKLVKNTIHDFQTPNNWHNSMPQQFKKYNSGWDKQLQELGLPPTIYNEPAKKAPIKLIKIDHVEKYETDTEVKYVIFIILQKKGIKNIDQMVVRLSLIINQTDINLDRDFFETNQNTYETNVQIEEIFIIGFLTHKNYGKTSVREDWYNFDGIDDGKMFSQKDIMDQLIKKKKSLEQECYNNI